MDLFMFFCSFLYPWDITARFIRLFVARMYDSYAKGLADRPTVYESKVSRMKWCPQPGEGEDLAKDDAIREIHGHQDLEKKYIYVFWMIYIYIWYW